VFDHKNFATQGLYPGLVSTRSIANLGQFEFEVTIEPIPGSGGGGFSYTPLSVGPTKYKIRIRVTRKGKTWEYEQIVGLTMAKVVAKVINKKIAEPTISVVNTSMVENKDPVIKVNIK
jgi:hypothetical protein